MPHSSLTDDVKYHNLTCGQWWIPITGQSLKQILIWTHHLETMNAFIFTHNLVGETPQKTLKCEPYDNIKGKNKSPLKIREFIHRGPWMSVPFGGKISKIGLGILLWTITTSNIHQWDLWTTKRNGTAKNYFLFLFVTRTAIHIFQIVPGFYSFHATFWQMWGEMQLRRPGLSVKHRQSCQHTLLILSRRVGLT